MSRHSVPLSPFGTARVAWGAGNVTLEKSPEPPIAGADPEDVTPAYFGWEIARSASGLTPDDRRVIAAIAAACVAAMRAGSTRLPLGAASLSAAMTTWGVPDALATAQALLDRARSATPADPVTAVIGLPGDRKPLIVDGDWLYTERMHALEERFGARIRERAARRGSG
ncbi:MAG TPA: hypothetical protein VK762_15700, partial [Polyangiaceae bacterium]|nr:hypothetical protein [Polyangiaceae bacterium]